MSQHRREDCTAGEAFVQRDAGIAMLALLLLEEDVHPLRARVPGVKTTRPSCTR